MLFFFRPGGGSSSALYPVVSLFGRGKTLPSAPVEGPGLYLWAQLQFLVLLAGKCLSKGTKLGGGPVRH